MSDGILQSINIALTDEMLSDIDAGQADVYLNEDTHTVHVSTGLDTLLPQRFVVSVAEIPTGDADDPWLVGRWIQTFTGKRVPLNAPRAEHICVEDIAHALSMLCRYTGHSREFYSVAEHSVRASALLREHGFPPVAQYEALMHDAAEAYVADINRPLKSMLPAYSVVEESVMDAIREALDVTDNWHDEVKWADNVMLFHERRDLLNPLVGEQHKWQDEAGVYTNAVPSYVLQPVSQGGAEMAFLAMYNDLRREMGL